MPTWRAVAVVREHERVGPQRGQVEALAERLRPGEADHGAQVPAVARGLAGCSGRRCAAARSRRSCRRGPRSRSRAPSAVTSASSSTSGTVTSRRVRFCAAVIVEERPVRPKPSTQAAHTRLVQSSGSASEASRSRCVASGLSKRSQISGARMKSDHRAAPCSGRARRSARPGRCRAPRARRPRRLPARRSGRRPPRGRRARAAGPARRRSSPP